MTNWRLAKSLDQLRKQINDAAPNRKKVSDGTIGDVAHSKTRSDHNPDEDGVVKAMDITHDMAGGCNCHVLAESLVASRDPRILYIIWNRRICSSEVQPWKWRGYGGANPHDHHMHISVKASPSLYDRTTPWDFRLVGAAEPVQARKPAHGIRQPSPPIRRPEPAQAVPDPEDSIRGDDLTWWERILARLGFQKKWPGR